MQAGGLGAAPVRMSSYGCVDVTFLFPGGVSGPPVDGKPLRSGGVYDFRGPASVRGLADVLRFAAGQLKSLDGKTIQDYAGGVRVLTDQVGIIGWSLGGTTAVAALGLHGKELRGIRWYASFESPFGEGAIDGEFGTRGQPNRFYNPVTGELDLSGLRYGANIPVTFMGRPQPPDLKLHGALFLDGNGNGAFETETDFLFSGIFIPGPPPNVFYSPMLIRAAVEKKLLANAWPAHIANLKEAQECWRIRDGVSSIPLAVQNAPGLAVIVFAAEVDHVQDTADHRHILEQYNGFQKAGARWIRLNPDANYVAWVLGRRASGAPQNEAGAKFDRSNIRAGLMPEPPEGPTDQQALAAAACELADRTHKNDWRPVLPSVLFLQAPRP